MSVQEPIVKINTVLKDGAIVKKITKSRIVVEDKSGKIQSRTLREIEGIQLDAPQSV